MAETTYTPELGDLICALIAEGKSLRQITSLDNMPAVSTIMLWVMKGYRGDETYKAFSEQYTHAREAQAEVYANEIIDIADDDSLDRMFIEDKDGNVKAALNSEFVQRSKIKIDARKWTASKLLPKKYGDKLDLQHSGTIETTTDAQIESRLSHLLGKAGATSPAGREGKEEE